MMGARVNAVGGRVIDGALLKALASRGVAVPSTLPPLPGGGALAAAYGGARAVSSASASSSSSAAAAAGGSAAQAWHPSVVTFNALETARDIKVRRVRAVRLPHFYTRTLRLRGLPHISRNPSTRPLAFLVNPDI